MSYRWLLTLVLVCVLSNIKAQKKLFGKYNFDEGGYAIVGLFSESDPNELRREMGEFYSDDINILNEFKKTWVFSKESPMYACGYHYNIELVHKGVVLESFSINLNCNVIATDYGYFFFDNNKLAQFKSRVSKLKKKQHSFSSITEGKNFIAEIKKDKNLLFVYQPIWTQFEGRFTFTYQNPDKKDDDKVVKKRLNAQIKKIYPKEEFILDQVMWGTGGEYEFDITCNKSLFNKFTVYPKKESWNPFPLQLYSYWKL